jgi:hypothetical protein
MFGGFGRSVSNLGRRVLGAVPRVTKALGDFTGRVGRFVRDYHQPLALGLLGAANTFAPDNEALKRLAAAGMVASAVATGKGIGHNFYNNGGAPAPP